MADKEHEMFSEVVQEARTRAGLTNRAETARRLGISGEALRKIENGDIIPRNDLLEKIVDVYGLNSRLSQRLYRSAFDARRERSRVIREQEELGKQIRDPGLTRLSSRIAAEIIDALRGYKQVSDRQMFREVNTIVQRCLKHWVGDDGAGREEAPPDP